MSFPCFFYFFYFIYGLIIRITRLNNQVTQFIIFPTITFDNAPLAGRATSCLGRPPI